MNKVLFGLALGAVAGVAVCEMPAVKKLVSKGKKKAKEIAK